MKLSPKADSCQVENYPTAHFSLQLAALQARGVQPYVNSYSLHVYRTAKSFAQQVKGTNKSIQMLNLHSYFPLGLKEYCYKN